MVNVTNVHLHKSKGHVELSIQRAPECTETIWREIYLVIYIISELIHWAYWRLRPINLANKKP